VSTYYLIDGYNLLFAMGVLHARTGPHGLEKARRGLLGLLRGAYGEEADHVTVIFDAAKAPPGLTAEQDFHGLHVRFAVGDKEADDVIEERIRHAPAPKHLTVVSDDHRIQQAARQRHCTVLSCADFLEWLARHRRQRQQEQRPETAEKHSGASAQDKQHWLAEFADLDHDPDMKDVFDPFGFGKE
jgi:predicted RNA-binding protein with PIN domain